MKFFKRRKLSTHWTTVVSLQCGNYSIIRRTIYKQSLVRVYINATACPAPLVHHLKLRDNITRKSGLKVYNKILVAMHLQF